MLFLLLLADKRDREAIAVAREYGNYCTKEQNKVIDELLQGTQNKDEDAVMNWHNKHRNCLKLNKITNVIKSKEIKFFSIRANFKSTKHYRTKL